MNFGQAIQAMQDGKRVSRNGWNGKGMWLALWQPGTYAASSELFDNCPPLREHALGARSKSLDVCGSIVMKTADGSILFGWLASQTDILADDWGIA